MEGMLGQIVGYSTTQEIWEALTHTYSTTTKARITDLCTKLENLKKDGLTVMEYIQKMRNICNNFDAIGQPVSY